MNEKGKEKFIEEYSALCKKHKLFVAYRYSDGPYFVHSIEPEGQSWLEGQFWFDDHIGELRKSNMDLHKRDH